MEQFLIDTNVVSDYLSASLPPNGMQFMDNVIDAVPILSIITQIELLCWNADEATQNNLASFISDSVILDITPDVVNHCVALRKSKKVKTPDAIIAATALANGLTLVTNNAKDFAGITGLKCINPHSLQN